MTDVPASLQSIAIVWAEADQSYEAAEALVLLKLSEELDRRVVADMDAEIARSRE